MAERLKQLELIGRGAMAEVYRGLLIGERGTSREVAIKRLRPELREDPVAVDLFVNEAKLAVKLSHPNVVHALELSRDDEGYALVVEWLDCATLEEIRGQFGPLPCAVLLHVARSICRALEYLHGLNGEHGERDGIVHRDVTPGNLFATAAGQVKLGDFGVAICGEQDPLIESAGTVGFAAPEQQGKGKLDGRTDLYGLGASLTALGEDLPPELGAVFACACATDPAARFESATRFETAITKAAKELSTEIDPNALRDWLNQHGGLPKRPAPPSLDGAVQSLIGGTREDVSAATLKPMRTRRTSSNAMFIAALLSIGLGVGGMLFWKSAGTDQLAAPPSVVPEKPVAIREPLPVSPPPVQRQPSKPKKTKSAVRVQAPRRAGSVSLNSVPWASVTVDGAPVGTTPIRSLQLTEGAHEVWFRHPPRGLEKRFELKIDADRAQTFLINLRSGTIEKRIDR